MPIRVLTWNMYYGRSNADRQFDDDETFPVDRFNFIAQYAHDYNIDVVFLQEHPRGATYCDHHDMITGNLRAGYGYRVFREMATGITNRVSSSNRSYAVLTRPGVVLGVTSFFHQNEFQSYHGGPFLRAPLLTPITAHGSTYNFLHWHNETGVDAQMGFRTLTRLLQHNVVNNPVIIGDLNVNSDFIDLYNFYNNWDDVVNNFNPTLGVDHILTPLTAHPVSHLNFVSDANHYPLFCDLN